jgi:aerobic-type carbon monoxide dehydrogenase small subunit (CoxS/CutS family)
MERTAFSKELNIMDDFEALKAKFDDVSRALNGEETTKTLAGAARSALDSTAKAYQGRAVTGIDYGVKPLMDKVGPFMPGQLIVIGGATKQGKSSLIEQIVAGAAINGHPVWINSGEMKAEELALRLHRHKKGCGQEAVALARIWSMERASTRVLLWPCSIWGRSIATVEGLAVDGNLRALQQGFIEYDGFQCGYCTPGQLCSAIGMASDRAEYPEQCHWRFDCIDDAARRERKFASA